MNRRLVQVDSTAISGHFFFSDAEIAVLRVLALCEKLNHPNTANLERHSWSVELSNKTRANPEQPWRLTAHSRTARNLEERGGFVRIFLRPDWDQKTQEVLSLTPRGHLAVAALGKIVVLEQEAK